MSQVASLRVAAPRPKWLIYAEHYLEGATASGFNGGVAALGGLVGPQTTNLAAAIIHIKANIPDLTPAALFSVFLGGFFLKAFFYFQAHPIPVVDLDSAAPAAVAVAVAVPAPTPAPPAPPNSP